jgi:ribose 5-phosphate isomerase A
MSVPPVSLKVEAARRAMEEVRSGMVLGLGTGSTSEEFVRLLGGKIAGGELTGIRAVCTSSRTDSLARSLGIEVIELAAAGRLDLAIDGADEVDSALRLIKGRGAALLREKIVEQAARRFIVIVDESKLVERLGAGPLPVEVTPFAAPILLSRFEEMGLRPAARRTGESWLVTDEGNHIIDVSVPADRDIAETVDRLRAFAGVIETGYFPDEASEVIVASSAGVRVLTRPQSAAQ